MTDATAKPKPITSNDVRAALKLRFPPESHALLWEVANTTGYGAKRYADAVAVGLWGSHGHCVEGIEVKVSRGDFLNEMKQPEKSQPIFQYCSRWWLACPKDMVKPDELPSTWGLLELSGDSLRVKVKAPKLSPVKLDHGFVTCMLRRHAGMDEDMTKQAIDEKVRFRVEQERTQLTDEIARMRSSRMASVESGMALLEKVAAETGLDFRTMGHRDEELIRAIKFYREVMPRWGSVGDLRKLALNLVTALDELGLKPDGK